MQASPMRVMIMEYPPYIDACAVEYLTLTPTDNCRKPGKTGRHDVHSSNYSLCKTYENEIHFLPAGVFAEFAYAVLHLAHINYTLIPVFIHDPDYVVDWATDGELGK